MLKVEKKVVEDNANLGKNTGVSLEELSKKRATKVVSQPLGGVVVSQYSIKKHLEEKQEEVENQTNSGEQLPDNHFSDIDLQVAWIAFLKELFQENIVAWSAINTFKLSKIGENQIEVKYSSDTAKKEFETIQIDFFSRFKHKVNNFQIEIIYREDITLKKGNLSKKQIFEQLVEINPVLKDLENLMKFDFN